ncbi:MAG: hypothetical protein U1E46_16625 [Hyphomicrobiales bacterium]
MQILLKRMPGRPVIDGPRARSALRKAVEDVSGKEIEMSLPHEQCVSYPTGSRQVDSAADENLYRFSALCLAVANAQKCITAIAKRRRPCARYG